MNKSDLSKVKVKTQNGKEKNHAITLLNIGELLQWDEKNDDFQTDLALIP